MFAPDSAERSAHAGGRPQFPEDSCSAARFPALPTDLCSVIAQHKTGSISVDHKERLRNSPTCHCDPFLSLSKCTLAFNSPYHHFKRQQQGEGRELVQEEEDGRISRLH